MRANPYYLNGLTSALSNTSNVLETLTNQLSSGVRVNSLSDDPAAAAQNESILAQVNRDDSFTQTASLTEGMLTVADSALSSVVTQLTQAISVATEGNNGTMSAANQTAVAEELQGIFDEVMSLANTSYEGQYIFSGANTSTPAFSGTTGAFSYDGNSAAMTIETPNGQKITVNLPGDEVFANSTASVLQTLSTLISQFSSGTASVDTIASSISDLTTDLNLVSAERVKLDNSITRIESASSYASTERTQLLSAQTTLMQADTTKLASELSLVESQQSAESSVFATLSQHNLFDYLK